MKTQIVRIGNSRGIRIPKLILDQVGFGTDVEIIRDVDHLVIRPAGDPRSRWDEQFRAMADHGDDQLLDPPIATEWDEREWQ